MAAIITGLTPVQMLPFQIMPDDPQAHSKMNVYTYNKSMVVPVIVQ
jgi:hypothetical protein